MFATESLLQRRGFGFFVNTFVCILISCILQQKKGKKRIEEETERSSE